MSTTSQKPKNLLQMFQMFWPTSNVTKSISFLLNYQTCKKLGQFRLFNFSQFYLIVARKTANLTKIQFHLLVYMFKFYECTKFHYHEVVGRRLLRINSLKFLASDHLKKEAILPEGVNLENLRQGFVELDISELFQKYFANERKPKTILPKSKALKILFKTLIILQTLSTIW